MYEQVREEAVNEEEGEAVECIFCHLILPTNTIALQREVFGGHLEPSQTLDRNRDERDKSKTTFDVSSIGFPAGQGEGF